jgi:competence ComEA-like helix-hairpin-helix protein
MRRVLCWFVLACALDQPVARAADKTRLEGVVNLNTATPEELGLIPTVGPARVRNILAYRRAHPFRTVDELARIKGIGRKTVRTWRQHLAVSGPSTAVRVVRPVEPVVAPAVVAVIKPPSGPVARPASVPARVSPRLGQPGRPLRLPPRKGEPAHRARFRAPGVAELPPP